MILWQSKKFMFVILKLELSFLARNETFDSLLWYLCVSDDSLFNMQYGFAIEHWSYGTGLLCDTVTDDLDIHAVFLMGMFILGPAKPNSAFRLLFVLHISCFQTWTITGKKILKNWSDKSIELLINLKSLHMHRKNSNWHQLIEFLHRRKKSFY